MSIIRLKTTRMRLRLQAAPIPKVRPMNTPMRVPIVPIPSDHLKPAITREKTSCPNGSVPSQGPPILGPNNRLSKSEKAGSTV